MNAHIDKQESDISEEDEANLNIDEEGLDYVSLNAQKYFSSSYEDQQT